MTLAAGRPLLLAATITIALLVIGGLALPTSPARAAERPVVSAVFGDSFASGEGLPGVDPDEAECQRALGRVSGDGNPSTAWGVSVLDDLSALEDLPEAQHESWFAACTGARSDHFVNTPQDTTSLGLYQVDRDKTQYAEAADGTGESSFDVLLASFGGNDLGFDKVIRDCIGIDEAITGAKLGLAGGWRGAAIGGLAGKLSGRCGPGLDADLRRNIDDVVRNKLQPLYEDFAEVTNDGALIVVTGYPQIFEDPTTSWLQANAFTRRCHGMHFDDADMFRGLTGRFNQAIGAAVKEAAQSHPNRTWVFADVSLPFDGHGLCSDRDVPWLNGFTTGLGGGDFRIQRSYHPNQRGHDGYAAFISGFDQVEEWQPGERVELDPSQSRFEADPSTFLILVANGSGGMAGLGSHVTDLLEAAGYGTVRPIDADTVDESTLYYVTGFEKAAEQVASLFRPRPEVAPLPDPSPVGELQGANLVLVVAADLANE